MSNVDRLMEGYWRWLRDRTVIRQVEDWSEITTPYLDRHNDYMQIYARKTERGFMLTDGGETLLDLEHAGCTIDSPRRQAILRSILNGFGVEQNGGALQVHANADNFAVRKHNLIQAMSSVQDMFFLASHTIEALFIEDVAAWLEQADVRYTSRVKFAGKSGFDHMFDFVIPKSKHASERIARAINNPTRQDALKFTMAWLDTRDSRPNDTQALAFLNDNDKTVGSNVVEALDSYGIMPVIWSERERFHTVLAG